MNEPSEDPVDASPAPDSIRAHQQRRQHVEAPTHPRMAATLMMIGIVVLLVAIAAAPLLGR